MAQNMKITQKVQVTRAAAQRNTVFQHTSGKLARLELEMITLVSGDHIHSLCITDSENNVGVLIELSAHDVEELVYALQRGLNDGPLRFVGEGLEHVSRTIAARS